jgi:glyoxylase-like metal-dependent hydrolase (beta-lactamase superfamily II)
VPITETIAPDIFVTRVVLDEYDVRGGLLLGRDTTLVWDTLAHPRDMAAWLPLVGGRRLAIVYSHADWDHIWGTAGLPYDSARIVAHRVARERFDADVPRELAGRKASQPGVWDDVRLVPPTQTFDAQLTIDLGGLTLELHHLPGHTADCCVGFVPERGVLLAGDTVETPLPVIPPDSPLPAWIAELRRWSADARVRTVVPAHGPVGGRELIERNIAYLEGILSGKPIDPPGPLDPFYEKTHAANVRWRPAEA